MTLKRILYTQNDGSYRGIGTYNSEKIDITTYPARYFHSDSQYKNAPAIKVGFEGQNSDGEPQNHITYIVSTINILPQAARIKETGDMILFGTLERDPPLWNNFIEYKDLPNRESASVWTDITLIELRPLISTEFKKLSFEQFNTIEPRNTLPEPEKVGTKNKIMNRMRKLKL